MVELITPLQNVQNLLETGLLLTALLITMDRSISHIIAIYQIQSLLLAIVTVLSVASQIPESQRISWIILLIILLPLLLALVVRPLLARATILAHTRLTLSKWLGYRLHLLTSGRFGVRTEQVEQLSRDAEQEWLRPQDSFRVRGTYLLVFVAMLLAALLIASQIEAGDNPESIAGRIGLLASLVLALSGLYNTVIKQDIISQVIGLLMMDHGLYLAVVKIVPIPFPASFFVIGLYFYTLITMFILVILLPGVREVAESIELAHVSERSELKG